MWAIGRASKEAPIAVSAAVAEPAPSFQPENAATRIGERSSGISGSKISESDRATATESTVRGRDQHRDVEAKALQRPDSPPAEAPAPAAPRIADLRPGQRFAGRFGCVRRDRLVGRSGATYLALELRDRT